MLYSDTPRVRYDRAQLAEVICQFRFPAILSIGAREPVDFQEAVRSMFPRYAAKEEQPGPKITGLGTPGAKLEAQKPIVNHNFITADGHWKMNLTSNFISLSTVAYSGWEDFGQHFDLPLAQFIRIYQPAFFERIGLRYVNAISRKKLGLEDELWDDLIESPFIGILAEPDVDQDKVSKNALDVEMNLEQGCRMKLHAGPGMLSGKQDPEPKFILDGDFSVMEQNIPADRITAHLGNLHDYAVRLFNAATSQELKEAMGQNPMD